MSVTAESAEAFAELQDVLGASTITYNGITKNGVSSTIQIKRAQQLHGYDLDASTQFVMLASDFAEFLGIQDRVSKVKINDGDDLILMTKDEHPNSATVTLFLGSPQ